MTAGWAHPGYGLVCICTVAYPQGCGQCDRCGMPVVACMSPRNREAIYAKHPPMRRQHVVSSDRESV